LDVDLAVAIGAALVLLGRVLVGDARAASVVILRLDPARNVPRLVVVWDLRLFAGL